MPAVNTKITRGYERVQKRLTADMKEDEVRRLVEEKCPRLTSRERKRLVNLLAIEILIRRSGARDPEQALKQLVRDLEAEEKKSR